MEKDLNIWHKEKRGYACKEIPRGTENPHLEK